MTEATTTNSHIRFIPFKDLLLWDVKRMMRKSITSVFPIVKLGTFITEQSNRKKIFEKPNEDFKILGVNNKVGLFDAYIEKGSNINQPYKKVEQGWLAYNPYRINVGSIGIKLPQHTYDYISPAYVVFSCKKELHPEFLFLLFKSNKFNSIIRENTTGSVRQNLLFDTLSNLQIPLPSFDKQKELVETYHKEVKQSEHQEKEALNLESKIEKMICELLGIKIEQAQIKKGINIFAYREITKWSVDYILKQGGLSSLRKSKFPVVPMGQIIDYLQYGISEKSNLDSKGTVVLRMNNIQNRKIDTEDLKHFDFETSKLNKEKVLLQNGDLLFNRTNSKELVGKTAVFDLDGEYTFASYIIRLRFNSETNPYYVNFILNSKLGRLQIDLMSRQILGQANINSEELKEIMIPCPALEIQNQIVSQLNQIVNEQQSLLTSAEQIRFLAVQEFEQALFTL